MNKFLKTTSGDLINLDNVEMLEIYMNRDKDNNKCSVDVTFVSKREPVRFEIYKSDAGDLQEMEVNQEERFCPSPPGYVLASYYWDKETKTEHISRDEIVAWLLDPEFGFHRPITIWGNNSKCELTAQDIVICPDGKATRPGDCCYDTELGWLEEMRKTNKEETAA